MFCGKCGKEVAEGTKLCPYCGDAVSNSSTPAEVKPDNSVTQADNSTINGVGSNAKSGNTGKFKKLLIYAVVAVVAFLGFGAVVSMFDSTDYPDWLDKIPVVTEGSSVIGSEYVDSIMSAATQVKYDEIADDAATLGMPNDNRIKYYKASGYCGIYNGEIVYISATATGASGNYPFASYSDIAPYEPLIIKRNNLYLLCYKLENAQENCYVMFMATPSDPTTSYLTWVPLIRIDAKSAEFCDFLNGTYECEVVSVPNGK